MPAKTEHKRFPKFQFAKHRDERKGWFRQFADDLQLLRMKANRHM